LKVLHYVQSWLPLSAQFVHAQITRSAHPALVVSRDPPQNVAAFPFPSVVRLDRLTARLPGRADGLPRRVRSAALMALALRHRVGLVHVHFGYRVHDVLGLTARLRLPLVVSLHGHDATGLPTRWPHHYDGVLTRAAVVVVPSRFLAGEALALGATEESIRVIPAGVDTTWFVPTPMPEAPPSALFVGRLIEKKGIDVLVAAWPEVRRRLPEARLTVLGYGPLEHCVAGIAGVELQRPDPSRRAEQVREAMRMAHVVVSPSRTGGDGDAESLLLVNLEAQASGRPVVTTWHGGIPEFVQHGTTALIVPEAAPAELAEALITVLGSPALAARLGANGPEWARRFELGDCVRLMDEVYDSLAMTAG
jgi:glycosyltransferase involved in cell wall biosynthesis